ncbi:acyl carrier protein [Streptomyces sp. NPDC047017]|uniref:acyl carrier protein n=1 Tax=Streptomyces sp. NPDC047017 TaxID=3155024 RepID=UPI0033D7EE99
MSDTAAPALDKEDLRRTVADVLDVDESELTDQAQFVDELGVDSLMALEVMVVLEKKYAVKLGESELKEVTCLQRAYDLLAGKLRDA